MRLEEVLRVPSTKHRHVDLPEGIMFDIDSIVIGGHEKSSITIDGCAMSPPPSQNGRNSAPH